VKKPSVPFLAAACALALGGLLASFGRQDPTVDLDSAREIWSDVLRDADQIGLEATRMPAQEEMQLGARLAQGIQGWAPEDPRDSQYVAAVAAAMIPHLRRTRIQYRFHVVESPAINAFALPGGQIYVLRGMMNFLHSEAELAAVVGHEMAHVDLRHCVERYQYEHALGEVGAGSAGQAIDMARSLITVGYSPFQEFEADADGETLAIEAGYDPDAAVAVFQRLAATMGERPPPRANTPAGEVAQAMEQAVADYFESHPSSAERIQRLEEQVAHDHRRLAGRTFYIGVANFEQRVPKSRRQFPGEMRKF
jgi:predicted Zn-dependent protease